MGGAFPPRVVVSTSATSAYASVSSLRKGRRKSASTLQRSTSDPLPMESALPAPPRVPSALRSPEAASMTTLQALRDLNADVARAAIGGASSWALTLVNETRWQVRRASCIYRGGARTPPSQAQEIGVGEFS